MSCSVLLPYSLALLTICTSRAKEVANMATPTQQLLDQLLAHGLQDMQEKLMGVFTVSVDMEASMQIHAEAFATFTEYMEKHISQYAVNFEGEEGVWVPVDLLKFVCRSNSNFRFKLAKVVKGLTQEHYRQLQEEDIMELDMGNIGTFFLRWDIALAIMLMESAERSTGKEKVGEKKKPSARTLVKEQEPKEETLTEQQEASLALVSLQEEPARVEDVEQTIQGEDVEEEIPELLLRTLHPVVVDGVEFLFLDDITHTLEMHQDEALSVLAIYAGMRDTTNPKEDTSIQLDYSSSNLTTMLALPEVHSSMDSLVSAALVSIKESEEFYNSVPESSFTPHKRLMTSDRTGLGSIDITNKTLCDEDDASVVSALNISTLPMVLLPILLKKYCVFM